MSHISKVFYYGEQNRANIHVFIKKYKMADYHEHAEPLLTVNRE